MEKARTAIIGCGKVGHIHAEALSIIDESDFIAVCDHDHQRAKNFEKQFNVLPYTNVSKMIKESKIDLVIVCTPHPQHAEPAISAIREGAHVLVEKPLAANLTDCDAMIAAADLAGVKLGVMSQRRLYPPVQRVKNAITSGKIGKPILGISMILGWRNKAYYNADIWRGTWKNEGGGVLVNQAPHQLDLLQWFMGPIDELYGYWDNYNHPYIEVDDTSVAVLRFKNGAMGSIIISNSQRPGLFGKISVHGENGSSVGVQTDSGAMFIAGISDVLEPPKNDLWTVPGEENNLKYFLDKDKEEFNKINITNYFHMLQDKDFLRAVIDQRDPMVTAREGRIAVEVFTAIYRSQREKRPIKFPVLEKKK